MGSKCKSVKTLSYSFLLRLSEQQQSLHGVSSFIQPLLTNQQWRRFYCSRPLSKIRDPKIFRSFNLSSRYRSHSHSFSSFSSNSSSSKFGFVGWYLGKLESHPLTTKGISSSLIYVAADLTSQVFLFVYFVFLSEKLFNNYHMTHDCCLGYMKSHSFRFWNFFFFLISTAV